MQIKQHSKADTSAMLLFLSNDVMASSLIVLVQRSAELLLLNESMWTSRRIVGFYLGSSYEA